MGNTHVVLDLDSKRDGGASAQKFLAQAAINVRAMPRERTAGGVHVHLRIKDLAGALRKFPQANGTPVLWES